MHNVLLKCLEHILRAKTKPRWLWKKAFFWQLILNFGSFGVSFSKNREKLLSAVAKSFLRVVWCCKLYEKFPWTLRIILRMYNVLEKCPDSFLRAKNESSWTYEKSFFDNWYWILVHISCQKRFFHTSTRFHFWPVECVLGIFQAWYAYVKLSLESKETFHITCSIIRRVKMIWRPLRAIFVDFKKIILRMS